MRRRGTSKAGHFWWGYCPVCVSKKIDMLLNLAGLWECPECRAQVKKMRADNFVILADPGYGRFVRRKKATVTARHSEQVGRIIVDLRYLIHAP